MEPKHLKKGDACPQCGEAAFRAVPAPTEAEYAKAFDRENPTSLRAGHDTASPEQRKELGELHRCGSCGYQTRFAAEEATPAPAKP